MYQATCQRSSGGTVEEAQQWVFEAGTIATRKDPSLRHQLAKHGRYGLPVLIGLGLVAGWRQLIPGVAYWDAFIGALIDSVRFTAPAAAGLAAWVAIRVRRPSQARRELAALVTLALVAYVVTGSVLAITTLAADDVGRPKASGLIMGATGLLLHVIVGWLVGRLARAVGTSVSVRRGRPVTVSLFAATAIGTAMATFAVLTLATHANAWWTLLAPVTGTRLDVFQQWRSEVFAAQALWLAALTTTLLLASALLAYRKVLLIVPLAAAVTVAGLGVQRIQGYQGDSVVDAAHPKGYACRHWPITVCVHPALRRALPALERHFTPIAARLAGTPGEFVRVEQQPREAAATQRLTVGAGGRVAPIYIADLGPEYAQDSAKEFVDQLTLPGVCDAWPRPPGAAYSEIVKAWLRGDPLPSGGSSDERKAAAWLAARSEQTRRAWLRAHFDEFVSCQLTADDFVTPVPTPRQRHLKSGTAGTAVRPARTRRR